MLIILPLISLSQVSQNNSYSLEECVKIGLKNNNSLKASEARLQNSESKYNESKTSALPSLKLLGSYSRLSDIDPFQVTLPAPISKTLTLSPVLLNNTNVRLNLQQPIFTGSKISGSIDAAEFNYQSVNEDYLKDRNELVANIKIGYFNIIKAENILENINENIQMSESHIKDIKNFLDLGQVTKNDLLKVEIQLYNLKSSQVEAENLVTLSKLNLSNLMGTELNSGFEITRNEPATEEIKNMDYYIKEALLNRNDLKSLDKKIKMAESGINVANSNWFPQVYFNANYTYANPNQRIMPAQDKFVDTWDVGVTLSFDIWNWGANSHKVEQAESQYKEIKSSFDSYKDLIVLEVNQIFLNIKQIKESLVFQEKAVEQAEENYRIAKEKFGKGYLSSSELLDAETALLQTKNNYINTAMDYRISIAKLDKATGLQKY